MFQSTPSKRKETKEKLLSVSNNGCFNPLLPSGRRRGIRSEEHHRILFQSTPSKRKETPVSFLLPPFLFEFQSTPSKRKETSHRRLAYQIDCVSIHSFQAEGDSTMHCQYRNIARFNPLLPSGRRRCVTDLNSASDLVSIHSFQAEGDV